MTTGGFPAPSLGWSGTIPAGLSFKDNGNGTATISGTPTSAGVTSLTLLATNSYGTTNQSFTLTVNPSTGLAGGDRLAATADGQGYWIVTPSGTITDYGSAVNYGSMAGHHLNQPIVAIASTPDGKGYWLVASDGGVFTFGDAALLRIDGEHPPQPAHRGDQLHPGRQGLLAGGLRRRHLHLR